MIYELRIYRGVPGRQPVGGKIQKAWLDLEVVAVMSASALENSTPIEIYYEDHVTRTENFRLARRSPGGPSVRAARSRSCGVAIPRATAR